MANYDVVTWKVDSRTYRLQVENLNMKTKDGFLKAFSDWKIVGEVTFNKEGAAFGYVLEKNFTDKMAWASWCRNFSECPLYGYNEDESRQDVLLNKRKFKKVVQEKKIKAAQPKKSRQNICSRCGKLGHNKRSCREKV